MMIDSNILEVDLRKIKQNIKILKNIAKKKFYAVVKADAYGLGAVPISKYIEDEVDAFCVANINEAIELRKSGIKKDILILGYVDSKNYKALNEYNIISTIYDYNIASEMNKLGEKFRVHIKVETGHNRLGFKVEQKYIEQVRKINSFENIQIEGIFTHLSSADGINTEDIVYTKNQEEKFSSFVNSLSDISNNWTKHISNDAAIIAYNFNYDAVRSGISLYGVYPSIAFKNKYNIKIKEAFKLKSKISFIKFINKGEAISYSRTFVANRNMKIATISIGYADGYHRLISNKGFVLINGKIANIVGNITMDQLMVDVSEIECNIADEVVLIGNSYDKNISVDEVAAWANTISYEIMTSISKRVKRIYIEE